MSALNKVYKVRTEGSYKTPHHAPKGSLVVIHRAYDDGLYSGYAIGKGSGSQLSFTFRPCDLKRLEFHDEINE